MAKNSARYMEGAACYAVMKADRGEPIFRTVEHRDYYLSLILRYKSKLQFKLFAYYLAPTSIHLVFEPAAGASVSAVLHDLNSNYTKFFNSTSGRKGHHFQERPRLCVFEKSLYLAQIVRLVHGLPDVLPKEEGPECATSLGAYAGSGVSPLDRQMAGDAAGVKALADFGAPLGREESAHLWNTVSRNAYLGSPAFVERARKVSQRPLASLSRRAKILSGALAVTSVMAAGSLILYGTQSGRLDRMMSDRERMIRSEVAEQTQKIYEDLDEKYRADQVSYQALAKRLELERQGAATRRPAAPTAAAGGKQ